MCERSSRRTAGFHIFPIIDTVEYSKEHAVLQLCICLLITVGNLSIQLANYKVESGKEIHQDKPRNRLCLHPPWAWTLVKDCLIP